MGEKWREILRDSIKSIDEIRAYLALGEDEAKKIEDISEKYPICVNEYYLSLIDKNNPYDPIRKMCIPDVIELSDGGDKDTSGEYDNTVVQGMQHKYRQTALILSTDKCAMYCRHCFRKRMVGVDTDEAEGNIAAMAEYVAKHTEINNVLISGGDSFMNSAEIIGEYLEAFADIPNIDFIRFGTRIPVVFPQRIIEDEGLLDILRKYNNRKHIIIVTQFNHPKELTEEAMKAIRLLRDTGCIIRNQTVLLKGVNDDAQVLSSLMNGLVSYGIIPYYIFQCRPVEGVKNQFQVPFLEGIDIVEKAKSFMNGQAKNVKFVFSHPTGKIEILGKTDNNEMLFKYHQAKYEEDQGRIFLQHVSEMQCWI